MAYFYNLITITIYRKRNESSYDLVYNFVDTSSLQPKFMVKLYPLNNPTLSNITGKISIIFQ